MLQSKVFYAYRPLLSVTRRGHVTMVERATRASTEWINEHADAIQIHHVALSTGRDTTTAVVWYEEKSVEDQRPE